MLAYAQIQAIARTANCSQTNIFCSSRPRPKPSLELFFRPYPLAEKALSNGHRGPNGRLARQLPLKITLREHPQLPGASQ